MGGTTGVSLEHAGSSLGERNENKARKQEVYYPRVSAEAEDVRYILWGFGVLIKNDFEV